MGSGRNVVPEAVEEVKAEIERWRETRQGWGRMPEELWEAAVGVARRHGVAVMAREAGLDYMRLKKRLLGGTEGARKEAGRPRGFVEVDTGGDALTFVVSKAGP